MNPLKKSLLIALTFFVGTECSNTGRKLRPKLQRRQNQQKQIEHEVAQVFKTDDQQELAQEVKNINTHTTTTQKKQEISMALEQKIAAVKKEVAQGIEEIDLNRSRYVDYSEALEIVSQAEQTEFVSYNQAAATTKKSLVQIKRSSWTNSLIVKPFTQTYRLFLRVWNPKEYATLLEKERKALEHELNVQAHNHLMLLYVALDLEINQSVLSAMHMFQKDNFYQITTHAFEGGALLASDIKISQRLHTLFENITQIIKENFDILSKNPAIIQSIWSMTQVIKEAEVLKAKNTQKSSPLFSSAQYRLFLGYNSDYIEELCHKAAFTNKQVLLDNKKSYSQYLQNWISNPKNAAKAGLVIAAIGGLYLYGPAVPQWLKDYTNSSVSLIKEKLSQGYQTTISSMKNLWNKVRGYDPKIEKFLEDQKAIHPLFEAQEAHKAHTMQEFEKSQLAIEEQKLNDEIAERQEERGKDQYFSQKGKKTADKAEPAQETATAQVEDFFQDEFAKQQSAEQQYNQGWDQFGTGIRLNRNARIMQEAPQDQQQTNSLKDQQRAGQMFNGFDEEAGNELVSGMRTNPQELEQQPDQARKTEQESGNPETQTKNDASQQEIINELDKYIAKS